MGLAQDLEQARAGGGVLVAQQGGLHLADRCGGARQGPDGDLGRVESAAHLRGDRGASPALAAAGFSAFTAALALGRLAGDRLLGRFGRRRVVRASGLVAAAGAAAVVAAPTAALSMVGWAVLGAGLAAIVPAVLGAAPVPAGRPCRSPSPP